MMHHRPWRYQEEWLDPARKRQPKCERCGERIVFVKSAKHRDKLIPCQPDWEYGDGRKTLVVLDEQMYGRMFIRPGEDIRGRQPHFGNCQADRANGSAVIVARRSRLAHHRTL